MAPHELHAHLLRFRAEVTAPLRLPLAAGAALRGALFSTLRRQFCAAGGGPSFPSHQTSPSSVSATFV